jgi:hypothetical protein
MISFEMHGFILLDVLYARALVISEARLGNTTMLFNDANLAGTREEYVPAYPVTRDDT